MILTEKSGVMNMTRNITENPLINNVLYKQVFQKEDVTEIEFGSRRTEKRYTGRTRPSNSRT